MFRVAISILLLFTSSLLSYGACDFTTTDNVVIIPGGDHNAAAGYTQVYVLVDSDGNIVATSFSGNFGTQNFGSYNAYAINYETANPPTTLPANGVALTSVAGGCFSISNPLPITVCNLSTLNVCEDSGDDIVVALNPDYNSTASYTQIVVVVDDASGQILFISTPSASTGSISYTTTTGSGDLTNGNYTVYTVNYENGETLAGLGLTVGSAWTGSFGGACADASTGTAVVVDLCNVVCGTCTTPDCLIAGPYSDYATAASGPNHCSQINDISATPINGSTFTSYHQLTSSATGTVGVVISVGVNAVVGGTPCPVTRTATLYPIGGPCDGSTAITLNTSTANGSPYYNPEFTGLTPNTDYVLEVTFSVPAGCDMVDHCESYYAPATCSASVGDISAVGGTSISATEYELTNCETISFTATNEDLNSGALTYGWAIFSCEPILPLSAAELLDFNANSCYIGSYYGLSTNDADQGGISASALAAAALEETELWFLPYTSDVADAADNDGDGCYSIGTPIHITYIPPTCGDCSAPNCTIDNVATFDDRTYLLCDDPCADLNNTTHTTYHTVTTDNFGNVGIVQTVSAACTVARTAVLRDNSNACANPDINPTNTDANAVASGFNPEWIGLTPNTNYTLIITTVIGAGCDYDFACVDYYGIPGCSATAGLTTGTTSDNTNNDYVLCWNEAITISTAGFSLPGLSANEGFGYAVYSSPMPGTVPNSSDPNFIEFLLGTGTNASYTLTNDGSYTPPFINNPTHTVYLYPVTLDDATAPAIDSDADNCYDVGNLITITFLNDINISVSQDCINESGVFTLIGGYPEFFPGNYNITSTGSGNLNSSTVTTDGGTTSISNLAIGDTYGITIVDDNNCPAASGDQLYPSNLSYDSIVITPPLCSYSCDGSITIYSSDATQYSFDQTSFNGTFQNTTACNGTYTVSIEDNGCVIDSTITIVAPDTILITNSSDTTICLSTDANLTAQGNGGSGALDFYWNNVFSTQNQTYSPAVATAYDVFILDQNGCSSDTNSILVNLLPALGVTTFTLDSICEGENITLSANANGGDGNYTYSWTNDDGTGWSTQGSSITVSPNTTTTYTVELSDVCGSPTTTVDGTVVVNSLPFVSFSADTLIGCYPLVVNFNNLTNNVTTTNCAWNLSNGFTSSSCSPQFTFDTPGCYDITLTTTSSSGCSSFTTLSDYICIEEYPTANFSYSPESPNLYDTEIDFYNESYNNFSNVWSIDGKVVSNLSDFSYGFDELAANYTICLSTENAIGCAAEYCEDITIKDVFSIYVPNTFTPDNDGINDMFHPILTDELVDKFEFWIFDRWGKIIFYSFDSSNQWDGSINGNPCQQDVYVWMIQYKLKGTAGIVNLKGHVNLLR